MSELDEYQRGYSDGIADQRAGLPVTIADGEPRQYADGYRAAREDS